jgi:hypothetical protein
MADTLPLTDQHGSTAFAWFPPGTPTDAIHILPGPVYAELCQLAGVEPGSPWVAFQDRPAALAAVVLAIIAAGRHDPWPGT